MGLNSRTHVKSLAGSLLDNRVKGDYSVYYTPSYGPRAALSISAPDLSNETCIGQEKNLTQGSREQQKEQELLSHTGTRSAKYLLCHIEDKPFELQFL